MGCLITRTYPVASSARGVGYVQCDDEHALRLMPWYPFVITSDSDGGITWLPSEPYRTWAEQTVRDYLGATS